MQPLDIQPLETSATMQVPTAVVCEDDGPIGELFASVLRRAGYGVLPVVRTGRDLLGRFATTQPAVALVDLALVGEAGLGLFADLRRVAPACVLMVYVPAGFATYSAEELGVDEVYDWRNLPDLVSELDRLGAVWRAAASSSPS